MPCIRKKVLESGAVSYRIQAKAKDLRTGKFETKAMTWHRSEGVTEKQVQRELQRVAFEFEERFRKQKSGLLVADNDIIFVDYARNLVEKIKNTKSINYYVKCQDSLRRFDAYFGNVKFKDITPVMVQGFLDELMSHKVVKSRAFLTGDLTQYVKSHCIPVKKTLTAAGMSRDIFFSATMGNAIRVENAERLCKILGVEFKAYFRIETETHEYAKETISKHKRFLGTVLATAKRQRLVEHNFASRDYISPVQGYKKEIRILNDKEAVILEKYLRDEVKDPRWRASIQIALYMGLRRGEIAGLEWKDIDYENKTMTIQRSVQDVQGFGIFTKKPKTENSKRTITIPDNLIKYLKEYQVWWDNQKKYLGDCWELNDRLFCNEVGGSISPGLFRVWLQKILDRAGLPRVSLHSIRHLNVTLQLKAGIDMKTVSERAGHSRASTTSDIYSHFLRNSDVHASESINKIFE